MKIIGTAEEIAWIKEAIQNNCDYCPYMNSCNESAKNESRLHGHVQNSCKNFLNQKIEFSEI
ncbi:hypothetical protein C808_02654 [Lachnospiraceae bacterium M18-1]|nr:hypothetical protein C808_02654 [Lachnospiraceae bacterium M18-1]